MNVENDKIIRVLEEISQSKYLTQAVAGDLETTILETYPDADDDERFENVLHILACYEAAGGDYLYNEEQLREECRRVLVRLRG